MSRPGAVRPKLDWQAIPGRRRIPSRPPPRSISPAAGRPTRPIGLITLDRSDSSDRPIGLSTRRIGHGNGIGAGRIAQLAGSVIGGAPDRLATAASGAQRRTEVRRLFVI